MPVAPLVLVIEHETELGRVIRDVLEEDGYDVVRVRDPFGAIGVMRQRAVDLVVAGLPRPDGQTTGPLGELVDEFPDVALISVAPPGAADSPVFGAWRRDGHYIVLRQPFRLEDVIAAAHELVG
ncbi:MAG: hypothetical protein ACPHQP_06610 [Longimicrobiales bacterium]